MERLDPIPTIPSPAHPLADPNERVSFRVTGPLVEPPKTGIDWNNVLDACLFLTLLVVGLLLLYYREELKLLIFGEIFLNAGVTVSKVDVPTARLKKRVPVASDSV